MALHNHPVARAILGGAATRRRSTLPSSARVPTEATGRAEGALARGQQTFDERVGAGAPSTRPAGGPFTSAPPTSNPKAAFNRSEFPGSRGTARATPQDASGSVGGSALSQVLSQRQRNRRQGPQGRF